MDGKSREFNISLEEVVRRNEFPVTVCIRNKYVVRGETVLKANQYVTILERKEIPVMKGRDSNANEFMINETVDTDAIVYIMERVVIPNNEFEFISMMLSKEINAIIFLEKFPLLGTVYENGATLSIIDVVIVDDKNFVNLTHTDKIKDENPISLPVSIVLEMSSKKIISLLEVTRNDYNDLMPLLGGKVYFASKSKSTTLFNCLPRGIVHLRSMSLINVVITVTIPTSSNYLSYETFQVHDKIMVDVMRIDKLPVSVKKLGPRGSSRYVKGLEDIESLTFYQNCYRLWYHSYVVADNVYYKEDNHLGLIDYKTENESKCKEKRKLSNTKFDFAKKSMFRDFFRKRATFVENATEKQECKPTATNDDAQNEETLLNFGKSVLSTEEESFIAPTLDRPLPSLPQLYDVIDDDPTKHPYDYADLNTTAVPNYLTPPPTVPTTPTGYQEMCSFDVRNFSAELQYLSIGYNQGVEKNKEESGLYVDPNAYDSITDHSQICAEEFRKEQRDLHQSLYYEANPNDLSSIDITALAGKHTGQQEDEFTPQTFRDLYEEKPKGRAPKLGDNPRGDSEPTPKPIYNSHHPGRRPSEPDPDIYKNRPNYVSNTKPPLPRRPPGKPPPAQPPPIQAKPMYHGVKTAVRNNEPQYNYRTKNTLHHLHPTIDEIDDVDSSKQYVPRDSFLDVPAIPFPQRSPKADRDQNKPIPPIRHFQNANQTKPVPATRGHVADNIPPVPRNRADTNMKAPLAAQRLSGIEDNHQAKRNAYTRVQIPSIYSE